MSCVLELIRDGIVQSAHDCSDGGLAVALAECCMSGPDQTRGAVVRLTPGRQRKMRCCSVKANHGLLVSAKPDSTAGHSGSGAADGGPGESDRSRGGRIAWSSTWETNGRRRRPIDLPVATSCRSLGLFAGTEIEPGMKLVRTIYA